jgi:hypothetical protein
VVTTWQKRPWDEFANRRGAWGRALALLLGRTRGGLTLRELGQATGMKPQAVRKASMRLAERLSKDARLQRVKLRALRMLDGSEHEP